MNALQLATPWDETAPLAKLKVVRSIRVVRSNFNVEIQ